MISFFKLTLFQFFNSDLLNLQYFQLYRNAFSDLPNVYLVNIAYNDWFDFIPYLPSFITYFLFAPFPWILSNYKYFMATTDSIITIIIMSISLLVIINNLQNWKKHIVPAVLCFFIFVVPFSMIEAYSMGAVRHRMIIILLMLPAFSCVLPINIIPIEKYINPPKIVGGGL